MECGGLENPLLAHRNRKTIGPDGDVVLGADPSQRFPALRVRHRAASFPCRHGRLVDTVLLAELARVQPGDSPYDPNSH